ncbi:F1F0 ATP synthase subunit delta [Ascoidea rubescens DSM 1968]|uniref:ATP synthase subunit delta, mitochondrial n=1 Tax=Ascoidea rubescens DSM 1968 TaxID=1344418 RepID=A0A1D2VFT8_9ASCO|nr:ATP synthase delta subunit [Ascoidea rubescens DSM 1968]ODV60496.1 ATP synthase delta subunit [Ascoidea rubescens DSM 1968]
MDYNALSTIARSTAFVARRSLATEAPAASSALKLSFSLPFQTLYNDAEVSQVNIPAATGVMGVLVNHVPTVEELKPGVITIIENQGKSSTFFINGGFATVQPNSKLSITAIEAFPLDSFDSNEIKAQITEAQKDLTSQDQEVAAEASIKLELLQALESVAK